MTGLQRVEVRWLDAHDVTTSWCHPDDIDREPYEVATIGWLIPAAKPGHIVVAQSAAPGEHIDNAIAIPLGMVKVILALTAAQVLPVEPT